MGRLSKMLSRAAIFVSASLLASVSAKGQLQFGPIAQANHDRAAQATCDPDYGWLPGAEGTNKCYMLIKGFDSSTCYSSDPWGGYGMDWFDAMQCCYFQNSYLAEPQNQEETDKINTYLTISTRGAGAGCLELPGALRTGTRENQTRTATRTVEPSTPRLMASSGWTWSATLPITEFPITLFVRR